MTESNPQTAGQIRLTGGDEMVSFAGRMSSILTGGGLVFLEGTLGAGKTTLSRGLIQALGHTGPVKSPTYTLVEEYDLPEGRVCHFDLYRLEKSEDAFELGIEELFIDGVSLIEWPDRLGSLLPMDRLNLIFSYSTHLSGTTTTRQIKINGPRSWQSRINNAFQKQKHD